MHVLGLWVFPKSREAGKSAQENSGRYLDSTVKPRFSLSDSFRDECALPQCDIDSLLEVGVQILIT